MKKYFATLAMSMTIVMTASAHNSWPTSSFGKYPSWPVQASFPKLPTEPKLPADSKYPSWPSWPTEPSEPVQGWPSL